MKKTTTLFTIATAAISMMAGITLKAQITVTESDFPVAGQTYVGVFDTVPTVTAGSAGASQAWNLSAIKDDYDDTLFFVNPSSTPYASYFRASNLASRSVSGLPAAKGEISYAYYMLTSNSFIDYGQYQATPAVVIDTLNVVAAKFPLTYNTNWISNSRIVNVIPGSSMEIEKIIYYDTADGWGTVTTPSGSFNSIRVKEISKFIYDSAFVWTGSSWFFAGTYSGIADGEGYVWFANGKGSGVAEIDLDSARSSKVNFAYYLKRSYMGVDEINANPVASVFPNPASDIVNIVLNTTSKDYYIEITDLTGREMERTSVKNGKVQLSTEGYANGIYLYTITDTEGNVVDNGKFSVNR